MRALARFLACRAAAAALAAVLALPGPRAAFAHAVLVEAEPADGAVLETPPSRLRLRFNEPVAITSLRIVDGAGTSLPLAPPDAGPSDLVELPLPPLAEGRHAVSWRMVSADGHPVAGSAVFSVGLPAAGEGGGMPPEPGSSAWPGLLRALARAFAYAGCLTAAGGGLFLLFRSSPALDRAALGRMTAAAAGLGAGASLLAAGVDHAILAGDDAGAAWLPAGTWIGSGLRLRLAGLALLVLSALPVLARRVPGSIGVLAGVAGAAGVVASFASAGHASAGGISLPMLLVAVHLLGAAFWLGALFPLQAACRHPDRGAVAALMERFSSAAVLAVPVLAGAGLWLAALLVGGWAALAGTQYGRLLAAKALLVAAMLGLAALNRWRFTPRLVRDPGAAAGLRRSIRAEAVLGMAVLGLTAWLTSGPPPASLARMPAAAAVPGAAEGWSATAESGAYRLALRASPARAGVNTIELEASGPGGAPAAFRRVVLRLSSPGLGVEGIERRMEEAGPGLYRYRGADLVAPGDWRLAVELLVGDFEKRRVELDLPIR